MQEIRIGEIEGFEIGHAQSLEAATGCTVVLCGDGATAGVDVRGGAPGTRETDLLDPSNLVEKVHAVVLAGGSAFGLEAATGVTRYLEEHGRGFDVGVARVPIVCAAVLFDLTIGDPTVRPDAQMGYDACAAASAGECPQGTVGAGTGATVGKVLGPGRAMKGGLGWHAVEAGGLRVGALVAVNALGDIIEPTTGKVLAGLLDEERSTVLDTEQAMISTASHADASEGTTGQESAPDAAMRGTSDVFSGNTTLGIVLTNARLTKAQCRKLASMAHDGLARAMRPAHSMVDGDTIFALGSGTVSADLSVVGLLAARAVERAVVSGIRHATSLDGVPSHSELLG